MSPGVVLFGLYITVCAPHVSGVGGRVTSDREQQRSPGITLGSPPGSSLSSPVEVTHPCRTVRGREALLLQGSRVPAVLPSRVDS